LNFCVVMVIFVFATKKSLCCKITVFSKWDRCPKVGHSPNAIFSFSFAIPVHVKRSPIEQKKAGRYCHGTWKYGPPSGSVFCKFVLLSRIHGWQNNREAIRKYDIQTMSYLRTSVLFWEHWVIVQHQNFFFAYTRMAKKITEHAPKVSTRSSNLIRCVLL